MAIKEKDLPVSGSYGPGVYVRTVSASGASQKTGFAAMKEALDPTVDSALSTSSTNPVQNKVITGAVNDLKEDIERTLIRKLIEFYQGNINASGVDVSSTTYVKTSMIPIKEFYQLVKPSGITVYFYCYASDKSFISRNYYGSSTVITVKYGTIPIPANTAYIRFAVTIGDNTTTPADIIASDLVINCNFVEESNYYDLISMHTEINTVKNTRSGNVLDPNALLLNKAITISGGVVDNSATALTDYIPVKAGDVVVCTFAANSPITMNRLVTFDADKNVIDGSTTSVTTFTVPAGVSYIRFHATKVYMDTPFTRINLDGVRHVYEPYYLAGTQEVLQENVTNTFEIEHYPLTKLPSYIVDNLAYKPLGTLSKGYICFVSDDGDADVATWTIPTFISKNVPCTLAMMEESEVLDTQAGINTVVDAVNNHGFCISQHGGTSYWTSYDEYTLNRFFDSEKAYWDSIGITPYGACTPGHQVNNWIRALCGGRFGCQRSAYFDGYPWYGDTYYINGPRSNMYSLTSSSIKDATLNTWKDKCDLTLENNWLLMMHFHENNLTADDKSNIEAVIDYAKTIGLTFITMKDIPTII